MPGEGVDAVKNPYLLIIFRPNVPENQPTMRENEGPPSLKTLQDLVGGYIQVIPLFTSYSPHGGMGGYTRGTAYANEDGLSLGLPINTKAIEAWQRSLDRLSRKTKADPLVGTIVLVFKGGMKL